LLGIYMLLRQLWHSYAFIITQSADIHEWFHQGWTILLLRKMEGKER